MTGRGPTSLLVDLNDWLTTHGCKLAENGTEIVIDRQLNIPPSAGL